MKKCFKNAIYDHEDLIGVRCYTYRVYSIVRPFFHRNCDHVAVLVSFLVCWQNWRLSGNESFHIVRFKSAAGR